MDTNKVGFVAPFARVAIMLLSVATLAWLSYIDTGQFFPQDSEGGLVFQNGLLLIVLGSAIHEHFFTKPADSLVNSLAALLTLVSVYYASPQTLWWVVFTFCFFVFVFATINVSVSAGKDMSGVNRFLADITYNPAVLLGRSRVIFSIVFLFGVFSFYQDQNKQLVTMILFWGVFIAIWPLGLPELLSKIQFRRKSVPAAGRVIRTDWPNIVRFEIGSQTIWTHEQPKLLKMPNGNVEVIMPLYSQYQGVGLVATGIQVMPIAQGLPALEAGFLYEMNVADQSELPSEEEILVALGGDKTSRILGFIVEGSTTEQIRFENWEEDSIKEGMVIWCQVGGSRVLYQVVGGVTQQESFQSNRQGIHLATAIQLGVLIPNKGFVKYRWMPRINTPVFSVGSDFGIDVSFSEAQHFVYGNLPGTQVKINGPFSDSMEFHTAVLGITGSGKTELTCDLIKDAIANGIKVLVIDITGKLQGKLKDIKPADLSVSEADEQELDRLVFAVESGAYGAGAEKAALRKFLGEQRKTILGAQESFLASSSSVGVINLREISNTTASLTLTELFLDVTFGIARGDSRAFPRTLIVVDEAHTVMPEPTGMDYSVRNLVNKISQIALQGRKYKIGLLVVSQRTATISKSVLTQCNTVISFACIDDTSLNFLKNVYGADMVSMIPNLPPLNAIVAGKGIPGGRAVLVEIPRKDSLTEGSKTAPAQEATPNLAASQPPVT